MQYSFQQKALREIEEIAEKLRNSGFNISAPTKKLYNYEADIDTGKNKVKLLIYFGKKGIKRILQGDEQSYIYKELRKILFGEDLFENGESEFEEFDEYTGTDESGKGDYFGPLVIAGVYVTKSVSAQLIELGVKDSKLLPDAQIKILSKKMHKIIKGNCDVIMIRPEKYNQLYDSFGNLNKLLAWGHSKVIENIKSRVDFSNVISDKFGDENLIENELKKKNIEVNLFQSHKAERFIAVAAASILARAKLVDWFEKTSTELGVKLVKGAGTAVNLLAESVLQQRGEEYLKKLVKFHFKNSKEIF